MAFEIDPTSLRIAANCNCFSHPSPIATVSLTPPQLPLFLSPLPNCHCVSHPSLKSQESSHLTLLERVWELIATSFTIWRTWAECSSKLTNLDQRKNNRNQWLLIAIPVKSLYVKIQASVDSLHKIPRTKLCSCIFISLYRSKEFVFLFRRRGR